MSDERREELGSEVSLSLICSKGLCEILKETGSGLIHPITFPFEVFTKLLSKISGEKEEDIALKREDSAFLFFTEKGTYLLVFEHPGDKISLYRVNCTENGEKKGKKDKEAEKPKVLVKRSVDYDFVSLIFPSIKALPIRVLASAPLHVLADTWSSNDPELDDSLVIHVPVDLVDLEEFQRFIEEIQKEAHRRRTKERETKEKYQKLIRILSENFFVQEGT